MPEKTKGEQIKHHLHCLYLVDQSLADMQDMRAKTLHELLALIGNVDLDTIRQRHLPTLPRMTA